MVASFWFAVMTRGEEMTAARVSACAADGSRSTMKFAPRIPTAKLPAGFEAGRLMLWRFGALVPVGIVTGNGVPVVPRLARPEPMIWSVPTALPVVVHRPL